MIAGSLLFTGCTLRGVDERDYTAKNEAVLRAVPIPDGATLATTYSIGDRSGNGWMENSGPYTGFRTDHVYRLEPGSNAKEILRSIADGLGERWTLRLYTACERTFKKGHALVYIEACGESLSVSADHDAYE